MGTIFVARSAGLSDWASDVGLSKHLYKVGYAEDQIPAALPNWCGDSDWILVASLVADIDSETAVLEQVARKEKMVDPVFYPRVKGVLGIFKVSQQHVENHMVLSKALDGEISDAIARRAGRLKPPDFGAYVLTLARRA